MVYNSKDFFMPGREAVEKDLDRGIYGRTERYTKCRVLRKRSNLLCKFKGLKIKSMNWKKGLMLVVIIGAIMCMIASIVKGDYVVGTLSTS